MTLIGVKKLPKQAQREIERLRQQVEYWKTKALAAAGADPESTNVAVYGEGLIPDSGLPPNSVIVFRIGARRFNVQHEHGAISIRARDGLLAVCPVAANLVQVQPKERT